MCFCYQPGRPAPLCAGSLLSRAPHPFIHGVSGAPAVGDTGLQVQEGKTSRTRGGPAWRDVPSREGRRHQETDAPVYAHAHPVVEPGTGYFLLICTISSQHQTHSQVKACRPWWVSRLSLWLVAPSGATVGVPHPPRRLPQSVCSQR